MKTIYDFAFCEAELTQDVVFYRLPVGISIQDKKALAYLRSVADGDARFFLLRHSQEVADFLENVEMSLFPGGRFRGLLAFSYLRRATVPVVHMARFLRNYPAVLLNSARVDSLFVSRSVCGSTVYSPKASAKRVFLTPYT